VDLIENEEIRKVLKEAEATKNHEERVTKSVLATYLTKWWIKRASLQDEPVAMRVTSFDITTYTNIPEALEFILDIALSSPFAYRLKKLRRYTGIVFLPIAGGKPAKQIMKERKFTQKDALEAMELAIEYALWAESVYS